AAHRPLARRARRARPLVQRLRGLACAPARMGPRRRRERGAHDRGPGRLHHRHARERARQPARRLVASHAHDLVRRPRRGSERRARALGVEPRPRAATALRDRREHGGRVPAGDEDHGDMVPRGPRPRDRDSHRRPHGWLGDASPDPRHNRAAVAGNARRRLRARGRRGRVGPGLCARGAVSVPRGALRPQDGLRGLQGARPAAGAAVTGRAFGGPPLVTLGLAAVWGVTIVADSAQFSTAITELSPPAYVGTALTTQTCMGFALTMASIWLTPPLVRWAGWPWAFAALAIGPALGVVAMGRLRMLPDSAKLAGGRR